MNNSIKSYLFCAPKGLVIYQPWLLVCFVLCTPIWGYSQVSDTPTIVSSAPISVNDSLPTDSITIDNTTFSVANHKSDLDDNVEYEADDSIVLDFPSKKAYLYGNAVIVYQDKKINADYIVIDFDSKDVFATGIVKDSTLEYVGRPAFDDNGKVYEADTMQYNFETKKGISYGVLTTEKDGYIHGEKVLRDSQENIYVKDARFTTCNLPNPHFYIAADKIKVIPQKQIVTGPANLVISEIKTPLFVPFGFFPIPEKRKHGILFPSFGESNKYGFNLRNLGYYIPVNDYFDAQVVGDIYFRGSWRLALSSNYYKKYKYRGNLSFETSRFKEGEPEAPTFSIKKDYKIRWTFNRDAKAKPGVRFGANVNFLTSSFLKNNTTDYQDIISTNSTSSVSYGRGFFNRKLNVSLVSNMNQNLTTGALNMTLPQLTANVSRQMVFKNFNSKNKTAKSFMRNLGWSYQGTFKNEINTVDTVLVAGISKLFGGSSETNTPKLLDDFKTGVSHAIPISTSFKALKWVTVAPNFSYNEYWYFKTTKKTWDDVNDTLLIDNNINGFARAQTYRTSISLSTILYGMKIFKEGSKLMAIRHVVRPNVSAVWSPDFNTGEKNGYREVQTDTIGEGATGIGTIRSYSIYENSSVSRPSGGAQGSLNFGIGNNLEIKVRSAKDTANGGIKKVKIIESLNINSGYNFLADSFHLSKFRISANTTILNKIRITWKSTFDPYGVILNPDGLQTTPSKEYAWTSMGTLGHFTTNSVSMSTNLNPQAFKKKESSNINDDELEYINNNLQDYVDFNLPWSLSLNYNLQANTPALLKNTITQNIGFTGDISLTDNWKIGISSGYNITEKALSFTSLDFHRNLHCWEMNFRWYPIERQMFDFGIKVKSSTLRDLKLNRRRSWFDF